MIGVYPVLAGSNHEQNQIVVSIPPSFMNNLEKSAAPPLCGL